jgi:hypothetical protein
MRPFSTRSTMREASFALVRILGNDLPPCHAAGQTLTNLQHILDNEPSLPRCTKHWILNRIFDEQVEARIIALLKTRGQRVVHLPFSLEAYAALPDHEAHLHEVPWYKSARRRRARIHARRKRLNYATNNNAARNAAIEYGSLFADWVLPWDGNCFATLEAWEQILKVVAEQDPLYLVVPMIRQDNNRALDHARPPETDQLSEEPQLGFHALSSARFDTNFYYGRRDKVEMLWRLGLPGSWDTFVDEPWDFPRPTHAHDRHRTACAGWVSRLDPGISHGRRANKHPAKERNRRREIACLSLLRTLDSAVRRAASLEKRKVLDS